MQFFRDLLVKLKNKYIKSKLQKTPFLEGTTFQSSTQWLEPVLIGQESLKSMILSDKNISEALNLLNIIPSDDYVQFLRSYYKEGRDKFGQHWKYADIITTLNAITKHISITNYLEIGVRTGRSMLIVSNNAPEADLVGFDLWIEDYAGMDNPGAEHVKKVLKTFNHQGQIEFIDGDSKKTVPEYFKQHPDLFFDLVTVDGDHRIKGARIDLRNVCKRLKVGGILVFDDISSPHHPYLNKLWAKEIKLNPRFNSFEFEDIGLGIGIAIKRF